MIKLLLETSFMYNRSNFNFFVFFVIKIEIGYVFVKNILSVLILHIFTHNAAKSHENVLSTD